MKQQRKEQLQEVKLWCKILDSKIKRTTDVEKKAELEMEYDQYVEKLKQLKQECGRDQVYRLKNDVHRDGPGDDSLANKSSATQDN